VGGVSAGQLPINGARIGSGVPTCQGDSVGCGVAAMPVPGVAVGGVVAIGSGGASPLGVGVGSGVLAGQAVSSRLSISSKTNVTGFLLVIGLQAKGCKNVPGSKGNRRYDYKNSIACLLHPVKSYSLPNNRTRCWCFGLISDLSPHAPDHWHIPSYAPLLDKCLYSTILASITDYMPG
jgi:hypothetical protein